MPTLLEIQTSIRDRVLSGRAMPGGSLAMGCPDERLDIYANTIKFALSRALKLTFPAVRKIVGNDFFDAMAEAYLSSDLPAQAWLDQYGSGFASFVSDFEPAQSLPYLADVAQLEWAVNQVLHAENAKSLSLEILADLLARGVTAIRLKPSPSVRWLTLNHSAHVLWRAVLESDDAALRSIKLSSECHLIIERSAEGVSVKNLAGEEWNFFAKLAEGGSVLSVLESCAVEDPSSSLAIHLNANRFCGWDEVDQ